MYIKKKKMRGDDIRAESSPVDALGRESDGRGLKFSFGRTTSLIRQTEASECGLACLAMIASFHGYKENLNGLRRRFSLSLKGVTVSRLVDMAGAMGLLAQPLRLEVDELKKLECPCILHWDLNHFVVLSGVNRRGINILDPAIGERSVDWSEVERRFTGVAIEFSPGPNFRRVQPSPGLTDIFVPLASIESRPRWLNYIR